MWDAVRKIFHQDDAPEATEQQGRQGAQTGAPMADAGAGMVADGAAMAAMTPVTTREDAPAQPQPIPATGDMDSSDGTAAPVAPGTTIRLSPPGHAPQGLAAEGPAPVELETSRGPSPSSPSESAGGAAEAPGATEGLGQLMAGDAMTLPPPAIQHTIQWTASGEREEIAPTPPGVGAEQSEVVVTAPIAEPGIPDALPPATSVVTPASPPGDDGAQGVSDRAVDAGSTGVSPAPAPLAAPQPVTVFPDSREGVIGQVEQPALVEADAPAESAPALADASDAATMDSAPAAAESAAVAQPAPEAPGVGEDALLAPGTVVADRYTIVEFVDQSSDARVYRAVDGRSYERCWSCGSARNAPGTRFCQNCGAPIQNHQVVLAQTAAPTGLPDEVASHGVYLHVQPERRRFGVEGVGIEVGAHSAEGPHHPNEDSYWYTTRTLCANSVRRSRAVAVLADGMGGYAPGSGLISSRIAATVGGAVIAALDAYGDAADPSSDEAEGMVRAGIAAANNMVLEEIARSGEMGATLVVAVVCGDAAYLANIGDSRAYYVDPQGQAARITRDQSLVAREIGQAGLSEDDIYSAPGNNIILHAVGEQSVETAADWYAQPLEPDSLLVLCSDGYWKTMRGTLISEGVLRQGRAGGADDTLNDVARRMVDDALGRDSDDNTTVLLVAIS